LGFPGVNLKAHINNQSLQQAFESQLVFLFHLENVFKATLHVQKHNQKIAAREWDLDKITAMF